MVFKNFLVSALLLLYLTQNVFSGNITTEHDVADNNEVKDINGRRSNTVYIIKKTPAGGLVGSQMASNSYVASSSSGGSASTGAVHGWVSESHNPGNMVIQQPVVVPAPIQNQQACPLVTGQNILTGSEQASLIQQQSMGNSHSFGRGSAMDSHLANANSWQLGQNVGREQDLAIKQVQGQSSTLHQVTSHVTTNKVNEKTIISGNNHGVNNVYQEIDGGRQGNVFLPHNNVHKITLIELADGLYANELTAQQIQNLNTMVTSESTTPNIVAIPITRPQYGRQIIQGYRPNIQYYLSQMEANNNYNTAQILRIPSFLEHINSEQTNLYLSEEQLNIYKQYLIQSGLINLKPYHLIFSDQYRPKLKTLQWMVIPLNNNWEYCKQQCGYTYGRHTLYSTLAENSGKLPLKLLVPVLKVRNVHVNGAPTIIGAVNDNVLYRKAEDSAAPISE